MKQLKLKAIDDSVRKGERNKIELCKKLLLVRLQFWMSKRKTSLETVCCQQAHKNDASFFGLYG